MSNVIPGNVYHHKDISDANILSREMKLFPTPFKGIYYAPYETERKGWYISDPHLVVFKATRIFLKTDKFYFGLKSALYYNRKIWNAESTDIVNAKLSRKIIRKLPSTEYWRGRTIRKILLGFPFPIRFHRMKNFNFSGVTKKGTLMFSNMKKTRADAHYLCKKGDKVGCEVLKLLDL
ncbi:MAG: hypothetical protein ABID61_05020 [Candidatus Micrarchaeota archaeon]